MAVLKCFVLIADCGVLRLNQKIMIKKILLAFLALILLSSLGGYFYFDQKFTPPENALQVKGEARAISFQWEASDTNPYQALLLPVKLDGNTNIYYLQFDFGAPNSVLYKPFVTALDSLHLKEGGAAFSSLDLGGLQLQRQGFYLKEYGSGQLEQEFPIIGTLGADILEERIVEMNFQTAQCSFVNSVDEKVWEKVNFNKRKLLFNAHLNERELKLLYDSGTSGYQWITDKKNWEDLRVPGAEVKEEKGNSWGNTLQVFTTQAQGTVTMGENQIDLQEVTYVDGYSTTQELLMRFSGMQGMIGNKFFLGKTLVLDVRNERYCLE